MRITICVITTKTELTYNKTCNVANNNSRQGTDESQP